VEVRAINNLGLPHEAAAARQTAAKTLDRIRVFVREGMIINYSVVRWHAYQRLAIAHLGVNLRGPYHLTIAMTIATRTKAINSVFSAPPILRSAISAHKSAARARLGEFNSVSNWRLALQLPHPRQRIR
jgi:hypothetical protein